MQTIGAVQMRGDDGWQAAVVGDNCIDDYRGERQTCYPGGNAVNVAVHLRRLGVPTAYVGVVGTDREGDYLRQCLEAEGVNLTRLIIKDGPTGKTTVELRGVERRFLGDDPGVQAPFRLAVAQLEFLKQCRLAHFSGFTSWTGGLEKCQPNLADELTAIRGGPLLAVDFSDTPEGERLFDQVGSLLDFAFFSRPQLHDHGLEQFLAQQTAATNGIVVVTLGARGCLGGRRGAGPVYVPAQKGRVIDTLGAGDSLIAGFLATAMRRSSLGDALLAGAQNAAATCAEFGAWQPKILWRHPPTINQRPTPL